MPSIHPCLCAYLNFWAPRLADSRVPCTPAAQLFPCSQFIPTLGMRASCCKVSLSLSLQPHASQCVQQTTSLFSRRRAPAWWMLSSFWWGCCTTSQSSSLPASHTSECHQQSDAATAAFVQCRRAGASAGGHGLPAVSPAWLLPLMRRTIRDPWACDTMICMRSLLTDTMSRRSQLHANAQH